jgi:heme/copper-type cytochrome/quinol oxidase subunit 4
MPRRLLLAIIFGLLLRMAFINSPMTDAFGSMRQTYTAGYTRFLIEEGVTLKRLFNCGSIVNSHHALEVPIYNLLTVALARLSGESDAIYRLTSLIIWLLGAFYLAYLIRRTYGIDEAVYIVWVYTLLPLSIFIGHYYHPEVLSILLSLAVVFHYYFYLEKGRRLDLVVSVIALALALVVRASHFHLYFALLLLALSKYGWKIFRRWDTYIYILPIIPAALWSMKGSDLASEARLYQYIGPLSLRFSPQFWGMLLFNRLGGLTLSPVGLPLLILAIAASKNRHNRGLEFAWLYSGVAFLVIVAAGNFHHPHYQAPLLVPCAIFIGRFLYQMAAGKLQGAWQRWWLRIPREVIVVALSLYFFFDGMVIYLFFTQPWDIEALKGLLRELNITKLFIAFAISQAVFIPLVLWIWRKESSRPIGPRPANAAILVILILATGLFVLYPMYRIDMDYLEAGKSVRQELGPDAKVMFAGKKDDADPFIFYSYMHGWAFNPARLLKDGWSAIEEPVSEGAQYLAVMNTNRYIQPGYAKSDEIMGYLNKFEILYKDAFITVYDLKGKVGKNH